MASPVSHPVRSRELLRRQPLAPLRRNLRGMERTKSAPYLAGQRRPLELQRRVPERPFLGERSEGGEDLVLLELGLRLLAEALALGIHEGGVLRRWPSVMRRSMSCSATARALSVASAYSTSSWAT
jgi:hypothetical protein